MSNKARKGKGSSSHEAIDWLLSLNDTLSYAFQPIINLHTGALFGCEAVLHDDEQLRKLYFNTHNYSARIAFERALINKAIEDFCRIVKRSDAYLMLNLGAQVLIEDKKLLRRAATLMADHQLEPANLGIELNGRVHQVAQTENLATMRERIREQHALLVLDNVIANQIDIHLLYSLAPELIKLDRFFLDGIATTHNKRMLLRNVTRLAHDLGIQVIASGIDSADDLRACRDAGCDYAQGDFIQVATTDYLPEVYTFAKAELPSNRREEDHDATLIRANIEFIPELCECDSLTKMFDHFRHHNQQTLFPVVDCAGKPLGVLHEYTLRKYIYSAYGRELLCNRSYRKTIVDFISPCPVADVHRTTEYLLELYAGSERPLGILMTENQRYIGFISQGALLHLLDAKNIAAARDQNPLTRLPGNHTIAEYVAQCLADSDIETSLVYFDFDYFKPFNDAYGFRVGDRAIVLFADLLRKQFADNACFIGHIGGDDFFAGFRGLGQPEVFERVQHLLHQFSYEAQSLYDSATRERGQMEVIDRNGNQITVPLLRCSAAMLSLAAGGTHAKTIDDLAQQIAYLKKQAKQSPSGIACAHLGADN